jgi:CheY-like chemotaxis protein
MMPRMDGYEALNEIRSINPQAKVIVMTGYSIKEDTNRIAVQGVNGFIKKPFDTGELSILIHKVLNQS